MDKLPVGQLPDLQQSNNDDEIMVITNSEYNQLKKEKISDLITDFTSTNENNALTKGTDGKMFVTDFGNASNITEGTLPTSVLPIIPLDKIPDIPKDKLPPIETADLPVSGVSADTYAYPSSVTVNSQGQVTAIEAGEPGANNANQDLSNISEAGKEVIRETAGSDYHLTQNQITNCLLEVPQRVNVELNNGTLTLKAGSVVIVPYGTSAPTLEVGDPLNGGEIVDISWDGQKLFYFVKYDSDKSKTSNINEKLFILVGSTGNATKSGLLATFSGNTVPTSGLQPTNNMWYDTANNLIKYTSNGGISWSQSYSSLPFCITTVSSNKISSIDSIFNGFGFIGSTIWCDKGVKGLAADGRNSDGSLKNIEFETEYVTTNTRTWAVGSYMPQYATISAATKGINAIISSYYFEQEEKPDITGHVLWFNTRENVMYWQNNDNVWTKVNNIKVFNINNTQTYTDGKIDIISEVKQPFRAVDYNDTGFISNQSAPSQNVIEMSLGTSGTVYTAPTDGYFFVSKKSTASNQSLGVGGFDISYTSFSSAANQNLNLSIRVGAGNKVKIEYSLGGVTNSFYFIKTIGAS